MPTLLGSFTNTYLPSGIFMHMSVTVRTIPQPFAKETLSWAAKSVGRIEAVLKMTCRVLSRGFPREIYLHNERHQYSRHAQTKQGIKTREFDSRSIERVIEKEWSQVTYPIFMRSAPARTLCTVHLASLQLLFFISVATTAPR